MSKYCLDTSGFSNPLELIPEDIHETLWGKVKAVIQDGKIWCNTEILEEIHRINGGVAQCLKDHSHLLKKEIGDDAWPWRDYIDHNERMKVEHTAYISEHNGNRKMTVGLNDISIIAFAKALGLPLISMESPPAREPSAIKKRIPEVCKLEGVEHLTFNDFLRLEGIKS